MLISSRIVFGRSILSGLHNDLVTCHDRVEGLSLSRPFKHSIDHVLDLRSDCTIRPALVSCAALRAVCSDLKRMYTERRLALRALDAPKVRQSLDLVNYVVHLYCRTCLWDSPAERLPSRVARPTTQAANTADAVVAKDLRLIGRSRRPDSNRFHPYSEIGRFSALLWGVLVDDQFAIRQAQTEVLYLFLAQSWFADVQHSQLI